MPLLRPLAHTRPLLRSLPRTRLYATSLAHPLLIPPSHPLLREPGTIPLDASWHMPNSDRNARAEFMSKRLPRARFWDLDEIAEPHPQGLVGHMIPSAERFARAAGELGIKPESNVVIYDTLGLFSAPRALFTFKAMGHERVSVLDGGLPRWEKEGNEVETGDATKVETGDATKPSTEKYPTPTFDPSTTLSHDQILAILISATPAALILDARSAERFHGTAPEPRAGLPSGHIPGAHSLPFAKLIDPETKTLRPPEQLERELRDALGEERWNDVKKGNLPVVNSCGSGMTAAVNWLALQLLGVKSGIYDESWTGYASRENAPVVKTQVPPH